MQKIFRRYMNINIKLSLWAEFQIIFKHINIQKKIFFKKPIPKNKIIIIKTTTYSAKKTILVVRSKNKHFFRDLESKQRRRENIDRFIICVSISNVFTIFGSFGVNGLKDHVLIFVFFYNARIRKRTVTILPIIWLSLVICHHYVWQSMYSDS